MRRILLSPVLLATAVIAGSAPAAEPARELTFVRGGDLWSSRLDGSAARRIVRGPARESAPAWSPDGSRVAFSRRSGGNAEIWTADPDGGDARRLTRHRAADLSPAWSPDGKRIAFASNRRGPFEIYVARADGANVRRVARGEIHGGSYSPSWSPDGKLIAFSSTIRSVQNPEIYVVRPDGTGLRRLTHTKGGVEAPGDDGWPRWSPDGRWIVFSSNRTGDGEIWIMRADGSGERRLVGLSRRDDWAPRFSPDGTLIAFHSLDGLGVSRLHVVRRDGTALKALPLRGEEVDWRP